MKKVCVRSAVIAFWLAVWQIAAILVNNRILLAGPADVCVRLWEEMGAGSFYASVEGSLLRILEGFGLGMFGGIIIGACSFCIRPLQILLEPLILAMKSIPVAAFVIIVLIWIGSKNLAIPISFLVVFPVFYIQTITGLGETDRGLVEFARLCGMRRRNRLLYLYRPALMPYVLGAARVTIGLSFKSGIAAEVIGIPARSIGGSLYLSKIYMDTAGVLAWTAVVALLSFLCEKIILHLLRAFFAMRVKPAFGRGKSSVRANAVKGAQGLTIPAMRKTYQGRTVVDLPEMRLQKGGRIAVVGESGSGKTTWLKLLMGLAEPDSEPESTGKSGRTETEARTGTAAWTETEARTGTEAWTDAVSGGLRISPAFQEDCLFMTETAYHNVRMVCDAQNVGRIRECMEQILPAGAADQRAAELSGGMMRRTAVARAVLAGGDLLLLDEPFRGLDAENKRKLAAFILNNQADRTLIFTAHDELEAALLAPEKIVCLSDLTS